MAAQRKARGTRDAAEALKHPAVCHRTARAPPLPPKHTCLSLGSYTRTTPRPESPCVKPSPNDMTTRESGPGLTQALGLFRVTEFQAETPPSLASSGRYFRRRLRFRRGRLSLFGWVIRMEGRRKRIKRGQFCAGDFAQLNPCHGVLITPRGGNHCFRFKDKNADKWPRSGTRPRSAADGWTESVSPSAGGLHIPFFQ